MVRRILFCAAVAVAGQSFLLAGSALAKTNTRSCSSVTVGHYKATNVRVTPNLGCKAATSDLKVWLKQATKLPKSTKSWHAKLVKGTWQMAYGRYPVSLWFTLVNLKSVKPDPKPTTTPTTPPTTPGQTLQPTRRRQLQPTRRRLSKARRSRSPRQRPLIRSRMAFPTWLAQPRVRACR